MGMTLYSTMHILIKHKLMMISFNRFLDDFQFWFNFCLINRYVLFKMNHIRCVMVNLLTWITVNSDFKAKDWNIGICCLFIKHTALRSNRKDWLVWNHIMCTSAAICISTDCCFSELPVRNQSLLFSYKQESLSSSHQNVTYSSYDITDKLSTWCYTTITHSFWSKCNEIIIEKLEIRLL